jgi:hypothetical protein
MMLSSVSDLLEVTPLSDRAWQVCDVRLSATDERRVLARVERVHEYVLVTWSSPHRGWAAFPDLEGALRALRRTCAARPIAA